MRAMLKLAVAAVMTCSAAGLAQAQDAARPATPVTVDMLMKFSPKADRTIVTAIVAQWPDAVKANITTPNRIRHLLAQLATETGGFRHMEENLNYKPKRLREIFPKYVTSDAQALELAGNPKAIANLVYGGRLGNDCTNDGWNFRGSGLVQLTGRDNFRARGSSLNLVPPLVRYPVNGRTFPNAFFIATSYWTSRNVNAAADRNDLRQVRLLVNGGKNGLPEAAIWLSRANRFIRMPGQERAGERGDDTVSVLEQTAVEDQLVTLGFLPAQDRSSRSGRAPQDSAATVADSLRRFQASREIPQTGQIDDDTLYELTDPGNFAQQKIPEVTDRAGRPRKKADCVNEAVLGGD
jgi:putative chitinase